MSAAHTALLGGFRGSLLRAASRVHRESRYRYASADAAEAGFTKSLRLTKARLPD